MRSHYIGLMSGTSLDGVDGVLATFANAGAGPIQIQAHAHRAFARAQRHELLALNAAGHDELHRAALAGNALARTYASIVSDLLQQARVDASDVMAIGAHGQTVRHRPREFDGTGYTVQLNNPALLAELTGIDVVSDFRSRDVAAGGQGAPLVPAFHRAVFAQTGDSIAVLNVGGISNLSVLAGDGSTLGFDCGPGNVLMDHWCLTHTGAAFDRGGAWAASGTVSHNLLAALQRETYFDLAPPKSTGRDLFNPDWLVPRLCALPDAATVAPHDVQATLTELTAWACAQAVLRHAAGASRVIVCGGGALNVQLMHALTARLPTLLVQTSDAWGVPIDQVEAAAFAWLARALVRREPGNLMAVTGAVGPRVLGALYPGR
jgi:anhydro-N-acetylmuramic acid kinase